MDRLAPISGRADYRFHLESIPLIDEETEWPQPRLYFEGIVLFRERDALVQSLPIAISAGFLEDLFLDQLPGVGK